MGVFKVQTQKSGAMTTYNRLISSIMALERERFDRSSVNLHTKGFRSAGMTLVENGRKALREINASLRERFGALIERPQDLEDAATKRKVLQQSVERLESNLIQARHTQSGYRDELEQARSEASIIESRLQTKVAKLEMEHLKMQSAPKHRGVAIDNY